MLRSLEQKVMAGTAQEITRYLESADWGDEQLTLLVPVKDYSEFSPGSPTTFCDKAYLEELLLEALESPEEEVTAQDWVDIRQEVRERLAARKQPA